ncbi:endo alpha-1,4 polygalactosaminidase [Deinococcus sp.]|uniref:endo alpha-1,4 polygalactosaminidase n=1 Tax=Deinococcus sp. TaxID=47478 RepID=UPI0025F05239|nr:endo alpha-1,4 polygalactosaminidase [Deinococcus sp.]
MPSPRVSSPRASSPRVSSPTAPEDIGPLEHGQRGRRALAVYYGQGALPTLARYRRVVVQPGHFPPEKVAWLQGRGVQVLAYLSLGEVPAPDDQAHPVSWAVGEHRPEWGTYLVDVARPDWRDHIQTQVLHHKSVFDGFFLDTLDGAGRDPRQFRAMLKLMRLVRRWSGPGYLLANRGLGLLERLRGTINGVLIEACSTTWAPEYRAYSRQELDYTERLVRQARRLKLELYALDYADSPRLRRFALRRAAALGLPTFVTSRDLSLPGGYVAPNLKPPDPAVSALRSRPPGQVQVEGNGELGSGPLSTLGSR